MVAGQDLGVLGEQDEVLQDIHQPRLGEHAVEWRLPVGELGGLVAAVGALPLHEARLVCGDGADLGRKHVADDTERVVGEKPWYLLLVVLDLLVCVGVVGLGTRRALQLEEHERQAVYEHDDVGALVGTALDVGPLVHDMELVALGVVVVHQPHDVGAILLAVVPAHLDAALQHIHEHAVLGHQGAALDLLELGDGALDGAAVKRGVDVLERGADDVGQERVVVGVRASMDVGAMQVLVAVLGAKVVDDALFEGVLVENAHRCMLDGNHAKPRIETDACLPGDVQ